MIRSLSLHILKTYAAQQVTVCKLSQEYANFYHLTKQKVYLRLTLYQFLGTVL